MDTKEREHCEAVCLEYDGKGVDSDLLHIVARERQSARAPLEAKVREVEATVRRLREATEEALHVLGAPEMRSSGVEIAERVLRGALVEGA